MKLLQPIAIAITCLTLGFLIACNPQTSHNQCVNTINLDTLKARVEEQYGGGDEGVEEYLYLTTGTHQDFMGNTIEIDTQQVKNGYVLYRDGLFVDFVEFGED